MVGQLRGFEQMKTKARGGFLDRGWVSMEIKEEFDPKAIDLAEANKSLGMPDK